MSRYPFVRALNRRRLSRLLAALGREAAFVLLTLYLAFGLAVGGPLSNDLWLDGAHVTALQHVAHEALTQDGHDRHHGDREHVTPLDSAPAPVIVDFSAQLHVASAGLALTVDSGHLGLALLIVLASVRRVGWQSLAGGRSPISAAPAPAHDPPRFLRLAPTR